MELKYKIGKGKTGEVLFMTAAQVREAINNPDYYKSRLTKQQWAKIRKIDKRI